MTRILVVNWQDWTHPFAGGAEFQVPLLLLPQEFNRLFSPDFFAITLLTITAPVLCFLVDMWHTPIRLFRFLCNSTVLSVP